LPIADCRLRIDGLQIDGLQIESCELLCVEHRDLGIVNRSIVNCI